MVTVDVCPASWAITRWRFATWVPIRDGGQFAAAPVPAGSRIKIHFFPTYSVHSG